MSASTSPPATARIWRWWTIVANFSPPSRRVRLPCELIEPTPVTRQLFDQLRELGVKIALDDFGTGHSSLAYLRQFNVDFLKIDQSFVAMIGADTLSRHLLDSIIELSGKLGLDMVAEGVETVEHSDYLSAHGVNFLQGYLFARPISGQAFIETLTDLNGS